ncbi:MAG TPA: hypothetical protein PLQ04_01375 [Lachnospiraceae bacterium]|nr:hypothetical protein [Lachnospiraceae bacterium]
MIKFTVCVSNYGDITDVTKSDMQLSSKLCNFFTISKEDIIAYYALSKIYFITDNVKVSVLNVQPVIYNYIRNHSQEILDYYMIFKPETEADITAKIKACRKYFNDMSLQRDMDLTDYLKSCLY